MQTTSHWAQFSLCGVHPEKPRVIQDSKDMNCVIEWISWYITWSLSSQSSISIDTICDHLFYPIIIPFALPQCYIHLRWSRYTNNVLLVKIVVTWKYSKTWMKETNCTLQEHFLSSRKYEVSPVGFFQDMLFASGIAEQNSRQSSLVVISWNMFLTYTDLKNRGPFLNHMTWPKSLLWPQWAYRSHIQPK